MDQASEGNLKQTGRAEQKRVSLASQSKPLARTPELSLPQKEKRKSHQSKSRSRDLEESQSVQERHLDEKEAGQRLKTMSSKIKRMLILERRKK